LAISKEHHLPRGSLTGAVIAGAFKWRKIFLKIAKAMEMSPPSIFFKIELNISNIVKDYLCLFTLTTGQMPIENGQT